MFTSASRYPAVSQRLRRTILASILALSLLAGLGGAVNQAGAMRIDPDRGPGPSPAFCGGVASNYYADLYTLEHATTIDDLAQSSASIAADVAYWNASGCDGAYGTFEDFGYQYWWISVD